MKDWNGVLGDAEFVSNNRRFRTLVDEALSRFPAAEQPLRSITRIQLRKRSRTAGMVGLTTYCCVEPDKPKKGGRGRGDRGRQRITFYSELLGKLSDAAAKGV